MYGNKKGKQFQEYYSIHLMEFVSKQFLYSSYIFLMAIQLTMQKETGVVLLLMYLMYLMYLISIWYIWIENV